MPGKKDQFARGVGADESRTGNRDALTHPLALLTSKQTDRGNKLWRRISEQLSTRAVASDVARTAERGRKGVDPQAPGTDVHRRK